MQKILSVIQQKSEVLALAFNSIHRFTNGTAQELLLLFWHQQEPPESVERGAVGYLVSTQSLGAAQ